MTDNLLVTAPFLLLSANMKRKMQAYQSKRRNSYENMLYHKILYQQIEFNRKGQSLDKKKSCMHSFWASWFSCITAHKHEFYGRIFSLRIGRFIDNALVHVSLD